MSSKITIDLGQTKNLLYKEMTRNTHMIGFLTINNKFINNKFTVIKPNNNLFYVKILNEDDELKTTSLDYVLTLHLKKNK